MPDPKDPAAYPAEYETLARAVAEKGQVEIPMSSKADATVLRRRFCSWRAALAPYEEMADVYAAAVGIMIQLLPSNATLKTLSPEVTVKYSLRFVSVDSGPEVSAIQSALKQLND